MPVYSLEVEGVEYSTAYAEACAVSPVNRVLLITIELHHPSFAQPARIVADKRDLTAKLEADAPANGGEFVLWTAVAVRASLPRETDTGGQVAALSVDGVSRFLAEQLDAAVQTSDPLTMILREYVSNDLAGPARLPVPRFTLRNVNVTERTVTAEAVLGERVNRGYPALFYTPAKYPGLTPR